MVKKKSDEDDSDSDSDLEYIVFKSEEESSVEESEDESEEESEDEKSEEESESFPIFVINIKTRHVRFSNETVTHIIEIEDRKGYWVEDRFRFQQRCMSVKDAISFIFDEMHRRKMRLIVNMSDTLSKSLVPFDATSASSFSNISRGHMIMAPMCAPCALLPWWRS